jgi:hypothetical protein
MPQESLDRNSGDNVLSNRNAIDIASFDGKYIVYCLVNTPSANHKMVIKERILLKKFSR